MATVPPPGTPPLATGPGRPRCCPACGGGLSITRVTCDRCGTEASGRFGVDDGHARAFGSGLALDAAAIELLKALVECRDDVTATAQRLRIGQAELDERLAALGRRLAAQEIPEAEMPPSSFGDDGVPASSAEPMTSTDGDDGEHDRAGAEHALLHRLAQELAALDDPAPHPG